MKQEYKKYYEQFGLNVVYYRKKKRLTQMSCVKSSIRGMNAADALLGEDRSRNN